MKAFESLITLFGIATVLVSQPKVVQAIPPLPVTAEMSADDFYSRGIQEYINKDYKEAIENLTQAIRLNPDESTSYTFRSGAYIYLEDYPKAIADATQALTINPDDATAYNNRCYARARGLEDYQGALEDCNQSIRLIGNLAYSYSSRCYVRAALGEQKALEDRGLARTALGDKQGALEDLHRAVALFQQDKDTISVQRVQSLIEKLQE